MEREEGGREGEGRGGREGKDELIAVSGLMTRGGGGRRGRGRGGGRFVCESIGSV